MNEPIAAEYTIDVKSPSSSDGYWWVPLIGGVLRNEDDVTKMYSLYEGYRKANPEGRHRIVRIDRTVITDSLRVPDSIEPGGVPAS